MCRELKNSTYSQSILVSGEYRVSGGMSGEKSAGGGGGGEQRVEYPCLASEMVLKSVDIQ